MGQTLIASVPTVRKHICLPVFLQDGGRDDLEAMAYIKHWAISCQSSSSVVSWLKDHGEERWRLSQAASRNSQLFKATLQTSSSELGLTGCIGARLGINVPDVQGVPHSCVISAFMLDIPWHYAI